MYVCFCFPTKTYSKRIILYILSQYSKACDLAQVAIKFIRSLSLSLNYLVNLQMTLFNRLFTSPSNMSLGSDTWRQSHVSDVLICVLNCFLCGSLFHSFLVCSSVCDEANQIVLPDSFLCIKI